MNKDSAYPYLVSLVFAIYLLTLLKTPFGKNIIPYGYLIALGSVSLITVFALLEQSIRVQREKFSILLIISILFIFSLISTSWSQYPQLTFQRSIMSFLGIIGALIIVSKDKNPRHTFKLISIVMFTSISVLSLLGITIYFFGHNITMNGVGLQLLSIGPVDIIQNTMGPENRIASPYLENPNTLAALIVISIPLSVYLFYISRSIIVISGILVQFTSLYLTFSRAGLIATITSLTVLFAFLIYEKYDPLLIVKIGFILSIPSIFVINYIPGVNRFMSTSFSVRKTTWSALYQYFKQNPITGTGFGVSNEVILYVTEGTASGTHSDYFAMLAELGVIGILLLLSLLTIGFLIGLKNHLSSHHSHRIYFAVAMAVFISLSVRGIAETVILRPTFIQLIWAYMFAFVVNSFSTNISTISNPPDDFEISS